jgi:hypothetical protein
MPLEPGRLATFSRVACRVEFAVTSVRNRLADAKLGAGLHLVPQACKKADDLIVIARLVVCIVREQLIVHTRRCHCRCHIRSVLNDAQ